MDGDWALAEPPIAPARRGCSKRTVDAREVVGGLIDGAITGWRVDKATIVPCSDGVVVSHDQSAETGHGH